MISRDDIARVTSKRREPSPAVEAKIARLGRGRDLKTRCVWPGGTLEFDMSVLTQSERTECEAEARAAIVARGLDVSSTSPPIVEAVLVEKAVHVLAAAMRDASGGRLFADATELADVATDDEIEQLIGMYGRHRSATDPSIDALSAEELAEIDDCLKKKDVIRLSDIVSRMRPASLPTLVAMLAISLIGKSTSMQASSESPEMTPPPPLAPTSRDGFA